MREITRLPAEELEQKSWSRRLNGMRRGLT